MTAMDLPSHGVVGEDQSVVEGGAGVVLALEFLKRNGGSIGIVRFGALALGGFNEIVLVVVETAFSFGLDEAPKIVEKPVASGKSRAQSPRCQ